MRNAEQMEAYNKTINDSILVSQMMDSEGFKIFKAFVLKRLEPGEESIKYQDINFLKEETLSYAKGSVAAFEDCMTFFEMSKAQALTPKIDPTTGINEVLNKKKKK